MQKAEKCNGVKIMHAQHSFVERMWLTWLAELYDENDCSLDWWLLKSEWPNEAQTILQVFSNWTTALAELDKFLDECDQEKRQSDQRRMQIINRDFSAVCKHSLEDLLQALIKIQEYYGDINVVPTNSQIRACAPILHTPWPTVFRNRLGPKKKWLRYIRCYRKATTETKEIVLREIEEETRRLRIEERMACNEVYDLQCKRGHNDQIPVEVLLDDLRRIRAHLKLKDNELPTGEQMAQCTKEIGTASYVTMNRRLGHKEHWLELLHRQDEDAEIKAFMQQYKSLKMRKKVLDLDSLRAKMDQVATPEEQATMLVLLDGIKDVCAGKTFRLSVKVFGKKHNLKIQA